jgi:hypothetical protein
MASSPLPETNERPTINIPNNTEGPPTKVQNLPIFRPHNKPTVNSGNTGGFPNVKDTMLKERGYVRRGADRYLMQGNSGILIINKGPEIEVTVEKGMHSKNSKLIYTFKDSLGNLYDLPIYGSWLFYGRTTPVPIRRYPTTRRCRKTRRKQKGGFYPSVYGGVCGAKILAPLVARQMMRMYETHSKRKTKRRSKKLFNKKRG